jgi:serine/threonine protein kinase
MEAHLKASVTVPGPAGDKLYKKEKVIGKGATGIVCTYRAQDGDRVVVKVSYCGLPDAEATGTAEMRKALDAGDASKTDCGAATGYSMCATCNYDATQILRPPLSYSYESPCFYAVFPYVRYNLAEWLFNNQKRKATTLRDMFLQTLSIMRCLRTRKYWYNDIKPSNFLVVENEGGREVRIEIGDLGGLDAYGAASITISPGRLAPDVVSKLSWNDLDASISTLLGELLLQMLTKTGSGDDTNAPVVDYFACLQKQSRVVCEKDLVAKVKSSLAAGLTLGDPLVVDLVSVAFLLMGYKEMKLSWQDVQGLSGPLNTL